MVSRVGDELTVTVSKLVHGGWGLARDGHGVVFCRGVAPGEKVVARVREVKKSHRFAEVVKVLEPSPDRVPHVWPEAEWHRPVESRPGSADFGHLDIVAQRRIKTDIAREALRRHAGWDGSASEQLTVNPVPSDDSGRAWRTRETLHVSGGQAGPLAFRSRSVVSVDSLPLSVPPVQEARLLEKRWPTDDRLRVVWSAETGVIIQTIGEAPLSRTESVKGWEFELNSESFWQIHSSAPQVLWEAVIEATNWSLFDPDAPNLDLYGGVGLFAAALISRAGLSTVIETVEVDKAASGFAKINLSSAPRARATAEDVGSFLRRIGGIHSERSRVPYRHATVIVDPPRSGLGVTGARNLARMRPRQVVYVACDPVAFSRDVAVLARDGYLVQTIRGFDLFPHTHHMELVACLVRESD